MNIKTLIIALLVSLLLWGLVFKVFGYFGADTVT